MPHDVHAIAAEAADIEASIEKFIDDALIADFQSTPLTTIEDVLEARHEKEQRENRLKDRAAELLKEEETKQKHEKDVRDLETAISVTQQQPSISNEHAVSSSAGSGSSRSSRSSGKVAAQATPVEENPIESVVSERLNKLESVKRSAAHAQNPYIADMTMFVPGIQASRQTQKLRADNELLRRCLTDKSNPRAFENFIRNSTTQ